MHRCCRGEQRAQQDRTQVRACARAGGGMDRRDSETAPALAAKAGPPPATANGTGVGVGGAPPPPVMPGLDASFDTNTVILLAALFLALLLAVALNSLARCALWCGGGRGQQHDGDVDGGGEGHASSSGASSSCAGGIKKRALRSIPVEVYVGGGGEGEEEEEEVCAICLGEFADGDKVRVLPRCGHGFHVPCVDAWLLSRGSCPTCRRPVIDGKGGGGGGRGVGVGGQSRRRTESDTIAVVIA